MTSSRIARRPFLRRLSALAAGSLVAPPLLYAGSNFCSGILVSADGRFVYAGNRLHDSIGIFAVGTDGTLTFTGEEWTHGDYPRSFAFDPAGEFLYCCNQRADHIAVFRADKQSGALQFTGHFTPVGNPSMIVFREWVKKQAGDPP